MGEAWAPKHSPTYPGGRSMPRMDGFDRATFKEDAWHCPTVLCLPPRLQAPRSHFGTKELSDAPPDHNGQVRDKHKSD